MQARTEGAGEVISDHLHNAGSVRVEPTVLVSVIACQIGITSVLGGMASSGA
jgi:hypothetical protein